MKKLFVYTALIAVLLTGCSNSGSKGPAAGETSNDRTNTAQENSVNSSEGNGEKQGEEPKDAQSIKVDKGNSNVEITLPASFFEEGDSEQQIADAKAKGISEAVKNADGSYTYKMPKSVYDKLLKETEQGVVSTIEELKNSKDFASIKGVQHNESYTEYTLVVDKAAYEKSFDGFAILGIVMVSMYYQSLHGVAPDANKVKVDLQDVNTKEIFNTLVYPDALNNASN